MQTIEPKGLSDVLETTFGIALAAETGSDDGGSWLLVRPTDLDPLEGFSVRVRLGWRSVSASFEPEKFAGPLMDAMSRADQEHLAAFSAFVAAAHSMGAVVSLAFDGSPADTMDQASWPSEWRRLSIETKVWPVNVDDLDSESICEVAASAATPVLGMALSLLTLEEVEDIRTGDIPVAMPEGALAQVSVNRYERSRLNRAACIAVNGTDCAVCGFSYEARYGRIGAGYIHVHHLVPLSKLGGSYVIDPAQDLAPVCANCHAMIHRTDPPLSLTALERLLKHAE